MIYTDIKLNFPKQLELNEVYMKTVFFITIILIINQLNATIETKDCVKLFYNGLENEHFEDIVESKKMLLEILIDKDYSLNDFLILLHIELFLDNWETFYDTALKGIEKFNNTSEVGLIYQAIGTYAIVTGRPNYKEYLEEAISEMLKEPYEAHSITNLPQCYFLLDKKDEAILYIEKVKKNSKIKYDLSAFEYFSKKIFISKLKQDRLIVQNMKKKHNQKNSN